jgi:hypothetical protein
MRIAQPIFFHHVSRDHLFDFDACVVIILLFFNFSKRSFPYLSLASATTSYTFLRKYPPLFTTGGGFAFQSRTLHFHIAKASLISTELLSSSRFFSFYLGMCMACKRRIVYFCLARLCFFLFHSIQKLFMYVHVSLDQLP